MTLFIAILMLHHMNMLNLQNAIGAILLWFLHLSTK